ncbi:aminotransferase class I/II-fold pyridoxal phosphate-dependent enzyme [Streptomyces sp. NPDC058664]|uniref:aminotransferase class I/II-fold pyridoxal phosphate-dependent enzyme n=1 Tax=unclassified Streptomyces TaxID=2593676 RepID=UPI003658056A
MWTCRRAVAAQPSIWANAARRLRVAALNSAVSCRKDSVLRDIAIVGMGCRFPGARNLTEYWGILNRGERQFRSVPRERWDHAPFYTPEDRRSRAGTYTDVLASVDGVDQFDARHYRISPSRVQAMDPQHRLLLDASREALQDAGWERRSFDRTSTGVYFGLNVSEYLELVPDVRTVSGAALPGSLLNMAASNVSRFFDFNGPSYAVDAACSATLVALHQALGHLASGECSVALVGGAYLALEPRTLLGFSKVGAVSASGVCRPFDRRADGFVLGDGAGVVVLRPLEEALAAGDRVYAVIQGIGVSNDGASDGPMTPSKAGQMLALRRAYADAVVSPLSMGVFEAHGTATVVGDATEVDSLTTLRTEAVAAHSGEDTLVQDAFLTSVKSLIGHSLGASGAASLIKTALMLHRRTITPMPATDVARPDDLSMARLQVPETVQRWESLRNLPRRAGVSNFGFGGTNVHVVLEEAPVPGPPRSTKKTAFPSRVGKSAAEPRVFSGDSEAQLFLFSAGALDRLDSHLADFLKMMQDSPDIPLTAIAQTLASRQLLRARLAIVAASHAELCIRIEQARSALATGRTGALGEGLYAAAEPLPEDERVVAFVFPGQGSQRPGMARDLYERFPVLRAVLSRWDTAATGAPDGFSLLEAVYGPGSATPEGQERLTGTDVCQPVLGAFGVGLTHLAQSLGLFPAVSFGHSVGEFPAAVAVKALEEQECLELLMTRGAHMRGAEANRKGGMLAVHAAQEDVAPLLNGLEEVWAACLNHPRQVVYSGVTTSLQELARRCAISQISTAELEVSNAFHSPLLDSARDGLAADLVRRTISQPRLTFVSSVSGRAEEDPAVLRELWSRHASSPVCFGDAASVAYASGARIFVQVYGGSGLLGSVRRSVPEGDSIHCVALTGASPDAGRTFLAALGQLAVLGVDIDAGALISDGTELVTLPPSPLATESHWYPRVASRIPAPATVPGLGTQGAAPHVRPMASEPARPMPCAAPTVQFPAGVQEPTPTPQDSPLQPVRGRSPDERSSRSGHPHSSRQDLPVNDVIALLREQLSLLHTFGATAPAAVSTSPAMPPLAPQHRANDAASTVAPVEHRTDPRETFEETAAADVVRSRYEQVRASVYAELSAVSAFPVERLTDEMLVTKDLGFDSLMTTELLERLRRAFPHLSDRITEGFLPSNPTIGDAVSATAKLLEADHTTAEVPAVPEQRVALRPQPPKPHTDALAEEEKADHSTVTAAVHAETRIEDFPELLAMEQRAASFRRNPYFLVHDGTMRDTTHIEGQELISFSSFNYLGLSGHPKVTAAVKDAVDRYGSSVSSTPLLSGRRPLHLALEAEIAQMNGCEAAMALVSGHATNVTVIGHLLGPEDLIIHDALAHDSILQGCKLSAARRRPFPHNDMAALDAILRQVRHHYRRVLIVVEGVYSMDGDIVDLPALIEVKQRHGAMVMIDEAHSIGVMGATGGGVGEHFGVDRTTVDLWGGTLSKALASTGGYVAGTARVIDYLKASVPGFVYSTSMTPADAAACLTAIRVMHEEPERLQRLHDNAKLFLQLAREAGINTGDSLGTPIVPAIVKDGATAVELSNALLDQGISVNPILHPAVPQDQPRLRFFVTSEHSREQIERTAALLASQSHLLGT